MSIEVELVPILSDNYAYILRDDASGAVAVVDPGEPDGVAARLGDRLDMILLTHHHADHVAGAPALKARYGAEVIGPTGDMRRVPAIDRGVDGNDVVKFGEAIAHVFDTPGHTRHHVAFWFSDDALLFAGDTLFSLGCGRLFEGAPAQMWASLKTLRGLPPETQLFCGHEYTPGNLAFALSLGPPSQHLKHRADWVAAQREKNQPTIPSRLGDEIALNPFLRADQPKMAEAVGKAGRPAEEVFAALRAAKDRS